MDDIEKFHSSLYCKFCEEEVDDRVVFVGVYGGFKYLKDGETACIECYIDKCVKECMHNLTNDKENSEK